jgi:hypothetical protein
MLNKEYKNYQQARIETKGTKAELLNDFEQWLGRKVSSGTAQRHCQDVEPYINTFLLYKGAATASPGARRIAKFLVYWFIRRATWANPTSIKENAASLEKFCSFMQEKGEIDASALKDLKQTIKEAMDERLKAMDE